MTESEKLMGVRLKKLYVQKKARMKSEGKTLTYEHVAESIKRTPGAVSQFMNATTPMSESMCYKMARFFGVRADAINPELAEVLPNVNVGGRTNDNYSIPLISWLQADLRGKADTPCAASSTEKRVLCPVSHSSKAFALRVDGLSMSDPSGSPSFDDGDIIHVDPGVQPDNKSLVVVQISGDKGATFKQLIVENGEYFLKALNPAWPNRIIAMPADASICGVVISKTVSYR